MRRDLIKTIITGATSLALTMWALSTLAADIKPAKKPNIVFILTDDQGWNSLSTRMDPAVEESRSDYYLTPNLDQLARDGMRFTHGYAPHPICSPSRHSIQFGKTPANLGIVDNNYKNRQHCDPRHALPNLIKEADPDYATGHFGKWHISFTPEECGFEENDGARGNAQTNRESDPKYIYSITKRATDFIDKQVEAGKPFFLQVSHFANHLRFDARPETVAKYNDHKIIDRGVRHRDPIFAAMNENMDDGIGILLKKIEDMGIADNTYVFYMSDNGFEEKGGTEPRRKAWPLAFSKTFVWEGGVRVPFIVRGPGIKPGSVSKVPVVGYDLMPTFLDIIRPGFIPPNDVEGGNFLSLLKQEGKGRISRSEDFLVFHCPQGPRHPQTAIIKYPFKLIMLWHSNETLLFDLDKDMSETADLSKIMPEKTEELHGLLKSYLQRVNAPMP